VPPGGSAGIAFARGFPYDSGMSLLSDTERGIVAARLRSLPHPVRLRFFTQTFGCETCADTRRILDELTSISPSVTSEEINLVLDREGAAALGVDRAPAILLARGNEDGSEWMPGVRFYGIPAGYAFMSLLEAIELVASGDSGLSDESREIVATVASPMRIQVFSTPT